MPPRKKADPSIAQADTEQKEERAPDVAEVLKTRIEARLKALGIPSEIGTPRAYMEIVHPDGGFERVVYFILGPDGIRQDGERQAFRDTPADAAVAIFDHLDAMLDGSVKKLLWRRSPEIIKHQNAPGWTGSIRIGFEKGILQYPERPNAADLANKAERDAAYAAEQKPDTSERAKQLTMGQTPAKENDNG